MNIVTHKREEYNKLNLLSKLKGNELREFITYNDLKSIDEYIVLLNTVLLSGEGGDMLNSVLTKLPEEFRFDKRCPICGHLHVKHKMEEISSRSFCPVCGLTSDTGINDATFLHDNLNCLTLSYYLNGLPVCDIAVLKELKHDLLEGCKILDCIPFEQDICLCGIPKDLYERVRYIKEPILQFLCMLDLIKKNTGDEETLMLIEYISCSLHQSEIIYVSPYIIDKVKITFEDFIS